MTITARYAGRCSKCGGAIEPGQAIDWDKETKRTSHVACPAAQAAPKAEAPVVSTEPAPIERVFTGRSRHDGPRVGYVFRVEDGQVLTVVRVASRFIGQDEVDDQDDFAGGGGSFWRFWADCRVATDEEAAPVQVAEAAAKAEAEAKAEAKRKAEVANAESVAKVAQLLDGLTAAGGCFDLTGLVETGVRETVASWRQGICDCLLVRLTLDGATCYLEESRGPDYFGRAFHGPRAAVERAWQAWATKFGITRETAAAWLVRYSECHGHEAYEFVAKS